MTRAAFALIFVAGATAAEPAPRSGACQRWLARAQDRVLDWGEAALRVTEARSVATVDWTMDDALKRDLAEIYARPDLADEQKLRLGFERWVQSPPVKNAVARFFVRGAARDALAQRSAYASGPGRFLTKFLGPHYNPLVNRSTGYSSRATGATPTDIVVASHEWTHAVHRNADPALWLTAVKAISYEWLLAFARTPATPLFRRAQEAKAIGGQWEFMRTVPREVRERLLARAEASASGGISPEERALINAVYAAGLVTRFVNLGERVIPGAVRRGDDVLTAGEAFEETFMHALAGSAEKRWYQIFAAKAEGVLDPDELIFVRAIMTEGRRADAVRAALRTHADGRLAEDDVRWAIAEQIFAGHRYFNAFGPMLTRIYIETLRNADLPKDEFVRRMSFTHGYTQANLLRAHYASPFRTALLTISLQAILIGSAEMVLALDVDALVRFFNWLRLS